MKYNDIGIDSSLDWNRIRKLFIIGLFGGIMTFVGDWLLGYGVYDESLSGLDLIGWNIVLVCISRTDRHFTGGALLF